VLPSPRWETGFRGRWCAFRRRRSSRLSVTAAVLFRGGKTAEGWGWQARFPFSNGPGGGDTAFLATLGLRFGKVAGSNAGGGGTRSLARVGLSSHRPSCSAPQKGVLCLLVGSSSSPSRGGGGGLGRRGGRKSGGLLWGPPGFAAQAAAPPRLLPITV
jgi:hypothetical protein